MSRVLDRGAIFAGWVGAGMAAVIVLSFELVIPVQPVVFYSAPFAGLLIGYYANQRSERAGAPGAGSSPTPCTRAWSPGSPWRCSTGRCGCCSSTRTRGTAPTTRAAR